MTGRQRVSAECAEVSLVRQVHTLFVRSAQQVVVFELQVREEVERMRQEVREVKGRTRSKRDAHFMNMWMTWMTNTRLTT